MDKQMLGLMLSMAGAVAAAGLLLSVIVLMVATWRRDKATDVPAQASDVNPCFADARYA